MYILYYLLFFLIASPSVALNNTISDTLGSGQLKHINFPITEEGITIKLHIHIGKATLYISSSISTPSEAFYDAVIETDEWGDIYLGPEDLCTANADTVYITIVGENFTNVTNISVSATNGDVSTGICNYIIHVCKFLASTTHSLPCLLLDMMT